MTSLESQLGVESLDGFMAANKKIFFYLGFWPVNNEPRSFSYYWRTFFRWGCIYILIAVLIVTQGYDLYLISDDWLTVCEEFIIIAIIIVAILICVSVFDMEDHKSLILILQEMNQPERLTDVTQRQMSEKTQRICNFVTIGIHVVINIGICILTSFYFLMVHLGLQPPRLLFMRGFHAWDATADPFYQITMTCQWIIMVFVLNIILAYNFLMCVVFLHVITQFRILRHKLENMRTHAVRNVMLRREYQEKKTRKEKHISQAFTERRTMGGARHISEDNDCVVQEMVDYPNVSHQPLYKNRLNEKLIVVNGIVRLHIGTVQFRRSKLFADDVAPKVHIEMSRILGECVEHYTLCKSCGDRLSKVFCIRLLYLMWWNIIGIIGVALYSDLAPGFDMKQFSAIALVVVGLIDFFILSAISSELTHQSLLIGGSMYSCDWFDAPEDFKRSLLIFMTAVSQPVVVYIAGYLPMSLETFLHVIHKTYSYYVVMSDMTVK